MAIIHSKERSNMSVGFYNFTEMHNKELTDEAKKRICEIIDTNGFIEGKYNDLFEEEFAKMVGAGHCLLTANGTDALEIALKAYDIGHGDLVGVPGVSFYASAEAIVNIGATPVFIDVDPATGLMDPESLKRVCEKLPLKAVMPVHIYGMPAPIEEIEAICRPHKIEIVEDGAQAHGTQLKNTPAGGSQNLTTFSFYPTKNLGAFGDAGCITTSNEELAQKIKLIRNHGRSPEGHAIIGRNSRCDHFQAAVLHLKLSRFPEENNTRRASAKKYYECLKNLDLELMPEEMLERSSWHLFPVLLKDKTQKLALREFLNSKKIGSTLFYERAMSEEKPLINCEGESTQAVRFCERVLCLPMNGYLKDAEVDEVYRAIEEFEKNSR
jgi:dTDP-4-amino-4,6-dideoxygalactose transaminase